jgi:acyl-CoA thioesterase-1
MKHSKKIGIGAILIFLVAVGFAVWLTSSNPSFKNVTNFPPDGKKTIAYGDSLVVGYGDADGGGFVDDLSKDLNINIVNAGISGETSADGLSRTAKITKQNPDIVLLLFGGNDVLQKDPKEKTRENLARIITQLQENGAVVVLLGVKGGLLGDPYKEMYENLAEERGTIYVPNVLDGIFGKQNLMHDQIHPNAQGYEIIAEKIKPYLKTLLESS